LIQIEYYGIISTINMLPPEISRGLSNLEESEPTFEEQVILYLYNVVAQACSEKTASNSPEPTKKILTAAGLVIDTKYKESGHVSPIEIKKTRIEQDSTNIYSVSIEHPFPIMASKLSLEFLFTDGFKHRTLAAKDDAYARVKLEGYTSADNPKITRRGVNIFAREEPGEWQAEIEYKFGNNSGINSFVQESFIQIPNNLIPAGAVEDNSGFIGSVFTPPWHKGPKKIGVHNLFDSKAREFFGVALDTVAKKLGVITFSEFRKPQKG
jgi:hypothetical protein